MILRYLWFAALVMFWSGVGVAGQEPMGAAVYTKAQADAGKTVYLDSCASCHATDLGGTGDPPALGGADFMASWKARTTRDLLQQVQRMPPGGPFLPVEQYLAVTAYLLQQNGATAGEQPLTESTVAALAAIASGERPREP